MKTNTTLISVIIPVFNGENFLGEAIQSVLNQNFSAIEIIIVDDGSTDNSANIAKRFGQRVQYFYQPNQGAGAARNYGLEKAQGNLISFLDSDDLWPEGRLKTLLTYFEKDSSLEIVLGKLQRFFEEKDSKGNIQIKKIPEAWIALSLGCGLFKREIFEKVGFLDASMRFSDDIDWFMRVREMGINLLVIDEVVLLYRRHEKNTTSNEEITNPYFLKALKNSLNRRRFENNGLAVSLPKLNQIPIAKEKK